MAEATKPTIRLWIPKFNQVCDVNADDAEMFRAQYNAIDEAAYLNPPKSTKPKGNPFKKNETPVVETTDTTSGDAPATTTTVSDAPAADATVSNATV
jgi:hypothetical protein